MPLIDSDQILGSLPPGLLAVLSGLPNLIAELSRAVNRGDLDPADAAEEIGNAFVPIFQAVQSGN